MKPIAVPNVLAEMIRKVQLAEYKARDATWALCIKPKPRWLPLWVWARLLQLVLVQEVRHGG